MNYKHKLIVANSSITDPIFAGKMVLIINDTKTGTTGVIVNAKEVGHICFGEIRKDDDNMPTPDMILNNLKKNPEQATSLHYGGPVQFPGLYFMHGYPDCANLTFDDYPVDGDDKPEFDLGIPSSFNVTGNGDDNQMSDFFQEESQKYNTNGFMGAVFGDTSEPHPLGMSNVTVMDGLYFGSPPVFCNILKSACNDPSRNKFKFFSGHAAWAVDQLQNEIDEGAWTVIEDVDPAEIFFDKDAVNDLIKTHAKKHSIDFDWMPTLKGFDPKRN